MRFGVRPSSHTREASCSDQPWKARLMSERHKKWDTRSIRAILGSSQRLRSSVHYNRT